MSKRTDLVYGRRGGNWVPDGKTPPINPARAPRCDVCAMPMVLGQRERHNICDTTTSIAERCTCPPGCTTGPRIGDGPRDCDPSCQPCRLHAGQRHIDIFPKPTKETP
jgi:hypothetical protein